MKNKLLFSSLLGGMLFCANAQDKAYVQIIHNSPDPLAALVDLYIEQGDSVTKLNDIAYRSASPYLELNTDVATTVYIAPSVSNSKAEAVYNKSLGSLDSGSYVVVASGTLSPGFNPSKPLNLYVSPSKRKASSAGKTSILTFHGITDATTIDLFEKGGDTLVRNLSYGNFQDSLEIATGNYTFIVKRSADTANWIAYLAPLTGLGLDGQSITLLGSGFQDPSNNNDGKPFGLFAVTNMGSFISLPVATAGVQIIHNSADAAADTVDLYVKVGNLDTIKLDNVAFRTATEFLTIPSEVNVTVAVAPTSSTSYADNLLVLPVGKLNTGSTYVAVANGLVSFTGYNPIKPLELNEFSDFNLNASDSSHVKVLLINGSTDAATLSISGRGQEAWFPAAVNYGEFSPQVEVATSDYLIDVKASDTLFATYTANWSSQGGASVVVVGSGFLNPAQNSDGPAFGLYVANGDGGPLVKLPSFVTGISDKAVVGGFDMYPNPASTQVQVNAPFTVQSMELLNSQGMLVRSFESNQMNITGLHSGVYAVRVKSADKMYVSKLTIE